MCVLFCFFSFCSRQANVHNCKMLTEISRPWCYKNFLFTEGWISRFWYNNKCSLCHSCRNGSDNKIHISAWEAFFPSFASINLPLDKQFNLLLDHNTKTDQYFPTLNTGTISRDGKFILSAPQSQLNTLMWMHTYGIFYGLVTLRQWSCFKLLTWVWVTNKRYCSVCTVPCNEIHLNTTIWSVRNKA